MWQGWAGVTTGMKGKEIPEAWIWVSSNLGAAFPLGDVRPFATLLMLEQRLQLVMKPQIRFPGDICKVMTKEAQTRSKMKSDAQRCGCMKKKAEV